MSTQREVFEGQTTARRAKRGGLWKGGGGSGGPPPEISEMGFGRGGPGVLPRKLSKTCIANGAIWVIPELYFSMQLAYIVIQFASKVSFKIYRPLYAYDFACAGANVNEKKPAKEISTCVAKRIPTNLRK